MTKREKLFDKIKNNPKSVTFSEIRTAGSHQIFKRGSVTFVVPVHNNKVKTVYIKRVIELIEAVKNESDT